MSNRTLYEVLEIPRTASQADIKKAYRRLAQLYHPDKAGSESTERFQLLQHGYEILSDGVQRSHYDASLNSKRRRASSTAYPSPPFTPNGFYTSNGFYPTFDDDEVAATDREDPEADWTNNKPKSKSKAKKKSSPKQRQNSKGSEEMHAEREAAEEKKRRQNEARRERNRKRRAEKEAAEKEASEKAAGDQQAAEEAKDVFEIAREEFVRTQAARERETILQEQRKADYEAEQKWAVELQAWTNAANTYASAKERFMRSQDRYVHHIKMAQDFWKAQ